MPGCLARGDRKEEKLSERFLPEKSKIGWFKKEKPMNKIAGYQIYFCTFVEYKPKR